MAQQPDRNQLARALSRVTDPHTGRPLGSPELKAFEVRGETLHLTLEFGYPMQQFAGGLAATVESALGREWSGPVRVDVDWQITRQPSNVKAEAMTSIKNIIAVASGKGGVGKSTTAVNLALAMAREGARVGILDADIYGPSQGMMLGIAAGTKPETRDGKWFVPLEAHGVQVMSMAFIAAEKSALAWRGPMVSGALQQMLAQTQWQDLDYLVVDMPPGTGDIQLTFAQKVPATGAVIVTTPQDIALLDGKRGIEMFRKVRIPVLGVVENMAVHVCSQCGHAEHLFGEGGGERLAREYETEVLASLPLAMHIREQTDSGAPTVVSEPDSEAALRYQLMARRTMAGVADLNRESASIPSISISND